MLCFVCDDAMMRCNPNITPYYSVKVRSLAVLIRSAYLVLGWCTPIFIPSFGSWIGAVLVADIFPLVPDPPRLALILFDEIVKSRLPLPYILMVALPFLNGLCRSGQSSGLQRPDRLKSRPGPRPSLIATNYIYLFALSCNITCRVYTPKSHMRAILQMCTRLLIPFPIGN
jgi:hypothetical protein